MDLPDIHSLKEKRGVVKSLLEKTHHRFRVATAEVDYLEFCGSAGLAFTTVGNDVAVLQSRLQKVVQFIESSSIGVVVDFRVEFLA